MNAFVVVFAGGGIGAAFRHGVNLAFSRWLGGNFPFHTLFENVSGSFVMGLLATYFALKSGSSQSTRLFFTTGILGGYTTFSAFSLETLLMLERADYALVAVYVLTSVAASIAGLAVGAHLIRVIS